MTSKQPRVLCRKTKMISFRVSSDEYDRLRFFCVSKGQRSVSDLARLAVSTLLDAGRLPSLESRLAEVEGQTHFLTRELSRMSARPTAQLQMETGQ